MSLSAVSPAVVKTPPTNLWIMAVLTPLFLLVVVIGMVTFILCRRNRVIFKTGAFRSFKTRSKVREHSESRPLVVMLGDVPLVEVQPSLNDRDPDAHLSSLSVLITLTSGLYCTSARLRSAVNHWFQMSLCSLAPSSGQGVEARSSCGLESTLKTIESCNESHFTSKSKFFFSNSKF